MVDIYPKLKRSEIMSRIRGRDNETTEQRMTSLFKTCRITGWRRNFVLFGKPDFVFRGARVAVFVDGCFWHGCPKPKHAPQPKSRTEWWANKLARNRARDLLVNRTLRKSGWSVVRVWECDLAKAGNWPKITARIKSALRRRHKQKLIGN